MFWEYSRSPTTSINPLFMLEIFLNSCQMSQRSSYNKAFLINLCQSFPLPFLSNGLCLSLSKDNDLGSTWCFPLTVADRDNCTQSLQTVVGSSAAHTQNVYYSPFSLSLSCVCVLNYSTCRSHYSTSSHTIPSDSNVECTVLRTHL